MAQQRFHWPKNSRVAFVLGIAFDCWDRNKPSRDGAPQAPLPANALCKRVYSTETFRDFGGKLGVKRLLDICDKYDLKVSLPINGLTCELWPELVKYAHSCGHELVAYCWDQGEYFYMLMREQERGKIFKTVEAITKLTGERPTGWSSPGVRSTDNPLELNLEAGLKYKCDDHDDEMPYAKKIGDQTLIMIPHQHTINDHRSPHAGRGHAPRVFRKIQRRVRLPLQDRRPRAHHDERHSFPPPLRAGTARVRHRRTR